jgi:hypothetical protein
VQCASAEIKSSGFGSTLSNEVSLNSAGDHPYITSAKRTGWIQKMAIFADVQYCIYADIVGGWVGGSEKVQKYAEIIKGWSLGLQAHIHVRTGHSTHHRDGA